MITALIIDDELPVRAHLRRLLEMQKIQVVGDAENAVIALQMVEELQPDVIFLDIRMPGLTGVQMAETLASVDAAPFIIFVTGYAEHAVEAFENGALDYLLKPVSANRLAKSLARVRSRLAERHLRQRNISLPLRRAAAEVEPLRRLPIRDDYSVHLLRFEGIMYAEARDKRVIVHTQDREYRTYYTLKQLEALLPAARFFRIHASFLVNLELIAELLFLGNHAYEVRLVSNARLPVGRTRFSELQRSLGLSASAPE